LMSSIGWIKLSNFEVPLSKKIKYRFSSLATLGRIRAKYRNNGDGSVTIYVEFDGSQLERVTGELSVLINMWNRRRIR